MSARYRGRQMAVVGSYQEPYVVVGAGPGGQQIMMPVSQAMAQGLMQSPQQMLQQGGALAAPLPQPIIMHAAAPEAPPADWMNRKSGPGAYEPDEDLVPLPLIPDANGGVFTATSPTTINWIGRVQKAFQGQRLFASVVPTGSSVAATRALAQIYVGTDPQMAQIGSFDLAFFVAGSFGVRHKWTPAEPGIDIKIPVTLSVYPTGTDSVFISMMVNGAILQ